MSNNLWIDWHHMPLVSVADKLYSKAPFVHANRNISFHVLIYVLKGYISVVEDGTEYVIKERNLFFLKAKKHHYGVHPTAPDTSWIYIHFYLDMPHENVPVFKPYTSHIVEQEFSKDNYNYKMKVPKMLKINSGSIIETQLYNLVDMFHSSNPLRAAYMTPLMYELLVNCCKEKNAENPSDYNEVIYKIIHYLENHTHEKFQTHDLCKNLFLSYKHIERIFKESTGKTLLEYHTAIRINEAARMIRETSYSIKYISLYMGYNDPYYFSNVFRKINGVSPKAYRKLFIENNLIEDPKNI